MNKLVKNGLILLGVLLILILSIWGPERLAGYKDGSDLNQVITEPVDDLGEGYRYSLNSNEKLYILSQCLSKQNLPETELNKKIRMDSAVDYGELTGTYAFIVNRQGPAEQEIAETEIYDVCNREIEKMQELNILPNDVRQIKALSYNAELYSAIDVLDPRNNMSVWKVSLSTSQQNADKSKRLLDAYVDADTGKMYEFYVRIEEDWDELEPENIVKQWGDYLELTGMEEYESDNPLLETTSHFLKYRFPGMEDGSTIVTIGFYEGINELFLKITG